MDTDKRSDSRLVFVVRHGERADYGAPEEQKKIQISFDPHLTELGKIQARKAGDKLLKLVHDYHKQQGTKVDDVKYLIISSPFRRCIQTAYHISQALPKEKIVGDKIHLDNFLSEHLDKMYYRKDVLNDLQVRVDPAEIKKHVDFELQDGYPEVGQHSSIPVYSEGTKIQSRVTTGYDKLKPYFLNVVNKDENVVMILVSHGYVIEIFLEMHKCIDWSKGVEYTCLSQYAVNVKDGQGTPVVTQCHTQLEEAEEEFKKLFPNASV